jgi:hypothetical protein
VLTAADARDYGEEGRRCSEAGLFHTRLKYL